MNRPVDNLLDELSRGKPPEEKINTVWDGPSAYLFGLLAAASFPEYLSYPSIGFVVLNVLAFLTLGASLWARLKK